MFQIWFFALVLCLGFQCTWVSPNTTPLLPSSLILLVFECPWPYASELEVHLSDCCRLGDSSYDDILPGYYKCALDKRFSSAWCMEGDEEHQLFHFVECRLPTSLTLLSITHRRAEIISLGSPYTEAAESLSTNSSWWKARTGDGIFQLFCDHLTRGSWPQR